MNSRLVAISDLQEALRHGYLERDEGQGLRIALDNFAELWSVDDVDPLGCKSKREYW